MVPEFHHCLNRRQKRSHPRKISRKFLFSTIALFLAGLGHRCHSSTFALELDDVEFIDLDEPFPNEDFQRKSQHQRDESMGEAKVCQKSQKNHNLFNSRYEKAPFVDVKTETTNFYERSFSEKPSSATCSNGKIPRGGSSTSSPHNIFTDPNIPLDPNIPMTPAQYEAALISKRKSKKKSKRRKKDASGEQNLKKNDMHPNLGDLGGPMIRPVNTVIPGYGKVEGRREEGVDIWRGIPYAAPPVGALRFSPPEPAQPWSPAKLDASRFGPDCWQNHDSVSNPMADPSNMSEDCLYLNVFTPAGHAARSRQGKFLSGSKLLPVMLWFHGGAFQQGGSNRPEYDGRRLAEREIVVVTINYRLGALGFLVSSRDGLFGNFGLMDQRAAMDWVHENIRAFGGDPDNVTLFGESAGALMIGLHLMMEGVGKLFHKAIMQSNPLGYTFRSVVVADFIGEALKRSVDCRDLACLKAERVEEIVAAQGTLMGVPRSVGDFFTWGPTLTKEAKLKLTLSSDGRLLRRTEEHRLPRLDTTNSHQWVSEWRHGDEITSDSARWSSVNVSQPLNNLNSIPDDIPVLLGSNKHEGELFVHSAFPAPMPKAVYWMFVGALFRDSSSRVLKHYRGLVDVVEKEAEELAKKQLEEEEAKHEYLDNREQMEKEYDMLLKMNATRRRDQEIEESDGIRTLVNTWARGGSLYESFGSSIDNTTFYNKTDKKKRLFWQRRRKTSKEFSVNLTRAEKAIIRHEQRIERKIAKRKAKALKEAAKVVVDYRPVMSTIIDDYLFRCPTWQLAQLLSDGRERRGKHKENIYMYRFSQPTHIPGYKECWGKSCHTSELPYVFQAMDVIRSNYSTLGPLAQREAPKPPEYPYTEILNAYRGAFESNAEDEESLSLQNNNSSKWKRDASGIGSAQNHTHTKAFQRIIDHFFGDYFTVDVDEELASDMAERWSAFASEGTPNYDASKTEWLPWRHRPEVESNEVGNEAVKSNPDTNLWEGMDAEDFWDIPEEYDEFTTNFDDTDYFDSDVEGAITDTEDFNDIDVEYRRRALEALNLEVADNNDVFRTELRQVQEREGDNLPNGNFLLKKFGWGQEERNGISGKRRSIQEILRLARRMGVIGVGLTHDDRSRGISDVTEEEFFPLLLDISWPPELRLIEKDCTCDMWDRIRYRY